MGGIHAVCRIAVLGLPTDGFPSTHILKPRHPTLHGTVENEAFCLKLASRLKLNAAPCSIGYAEDVEYLLVKRYDRAVGVDGKTVRLHQEDLCQASGFPPYLKYEWDEDLAAAGPTLKDCFDAARRTTVPASGALRLLDGLIFNVLVGNVDSHSKNYSLLIRPKEVSMAPLYDILNGAIYENITKDLAMTIGGQTRGDELLGDHWATMAKENGLSPSQVKRRVKQLAEAALKEAPKLADEMATSGGEQPFFFHMLTGRVTDRCRKVLANLERHAPRPPNATVQAPPYPEETHDAVYSDDGELVRIYRKAGGGRRRRLDNPLGPAVVGPKLVTYALDGEKLSEDEWRRRVEAGLPPPSSG